MAPRDHEALAAHDRANPERPAAPFAVNQIVHKSNARLEQDIELTVKWKAPIVITSLGAREDLNTAVHGYGGIVLHDIINNRFAQKALEKGADGLIAVAAGAGGHAARLSPFALVQDIREWFDGPLALSGAIATGRAILAAQAMGADLAYIGSAFIATEEARAIDAYKQAIVEGTRPTLSLNLFTGVYGNYLRPSIVKAGLDPDNLPNGEAKTMNFGSGGASDAKAWRDIWGSGQGIGAVKAVHPVAEVVARFEARVSRRQAAPLRLTAEARPYGQASPKIRRTPVEAPSANATDPLDGAPGRRRRDNGGVAAEGAEPGARQERACGRASGSLEGQRIAARDREGPVVRGRRAGLGRFGQGQLERASASTIGQREDRSQALSIRDRRREKQRLRGRIERAPVEAVGALGKDRLGGSSAAVARREALMSSRLSQWMLVAGVLRRSAITGSPTPACVR